MLWSLESPGEQELPNSIDVAQAAARAIVTALKGLPQPTATPPQASPARPGQLRLAQSTKPLSFEELNDAFVFDGKIPDPSTGDRPPRRTAFETAGSRQQRWDEKQRAEGSTPLTRTGGRRRGGKRDGVGMNHRRPGRGGRQPRVSAHNETTATAELLAEIGPPIEEKPIRGSKLWWWRHEGGGRGISFARLSGQEIHEGETVIGQVHANRRLFKQLGLNPLYTVVTLNNPASRPYHERPDFLFFEERLAAGEIDWIAARDLDRLLRNELAQALLFDTLRRTKTGLYLARFGRKMDWSRDKLLLQTLGNMGEHERDMTRERTSSSIISRYIAEGRGRPGSARFGFYRDSVTKDLAVDPEQWPLVKLLHYRYCELGGVRGGLRRVREELIDAGCEFSLSYLATMLRDPIYVTGEYVTRLGDKLVTCKPVALEDPIPAGVFQRNQEHLAQNRGPHKVTPPGFFCLNSIPLVHAACAGETVEYESNEGIRTTQPKLRARIYTERPERRYTFTHSPRAPQACKGYSINADVLERTVISELLKLARSRELKAEWARAIPIETAETSPILTKEERKTLVAQIRQLEAKKASLEDELVQRVLDDKPVGNADHSRLVGPIEERIAQLERRLQIADSMPRRDFKTSTDPSVKALLEAGEIDEDEEDDLLVALEEVLTLERPGIDDDEALRRRTAVVQAALSAVVVHDIDDGIAIELQGPLVPEDAELVRPIGPLESAREVLVTYIEQKGSREESQEFPSSGTQAQTVEHPWSCSTVCASEAGDDPAALTSTIASDILLPHEEVVEVYFSEDRPETPSSRAEWPLHPHKRRRAPRRPEHHSYRSLGLVPTVDTDEPSTAEPTNRSSLGFCPAWRSPRIHLRMRCRRGITPKECLESVRSAARSLDDPGELTARVYDETAVMSGLPCSSALVRRAKQLGLARGWPELRELAYADQADLADPNDGAPLSELAALINRPKSTLLNAAQKGTLRTYRRFGRFHSTAADVDEYFSNRKIGRPRGG